jgi:glycosyltransferase involved in cell wall biosynthesis
MPRISVITTAYNSERFIENSLLSILNQSLNKNDYEVIVINDGSTDNTSKIIKSIKDDRIKFFDYQENEGVTKRSIDAILKSTGEYIAIHDADDVSMPNRLKTQIEYMESNTNIFCVGSHAKKINFDGSVIGDWDFPPAKNEDIVKMLLYLHRCPMINPSTFFRARDYFDLGGYNKDRRGAHDLDFWCRAILKGKVLANIPEILIKYRVLESSMTRKNKTLQISDHINIIRDFLIRMKNVSK